MHDQQKILVGVVAVLLIILLTTMLINKGKKNEGYKKCICSSRQGGRERECQDTEVVDDLYSHNVLTEYTNLQSPGWGKISPGDYSFPHSNGCNWNDGSDVSEWRSWDFTDF